MDEKTMLFSEDQPTMQLLGIVRRGTVTVTASDERHAQAVSSHSGRSYRLTPSLCSAAVEAIGVRCGAANRRRKMMSQGQLLCDGPIRDRVMWELRVGSTRRLPAGVLAQGRVAQIGTLRHSCVGPVHPHRSVGALSVLTWPSLDVHVTSH
jgi:hypothetical protein